MSEQELTPKHPGGRPKGLPKTGGREKGTPNKTPALAQAIANRHSPDAIDYLVKVMRGQRFSQGRGKVKTWIYPSPHTRTVAAVKILDVAEMPGKRGLLAGTPLQVNIMIGAPQEPRPIPLPHPLPQVTA